MTPQEFILAARQREKTAGSGGWQWVFFRQMTAKDREAFDRFLVEYGYPLAFQPGTTEQRFRQMVLGRSAMKRNPPSKKDRIADILRRQYYGPPSRSLNKRTLLEAVAVARKQGVKVGGKLIEGPVSGPDYERVILALHRAGIGHNMATEPYTKRILAGQGDYKVNPSGRVHRRRTRKAARGGARRRNSVPRRNPAALSERVMWTKVRAIARIVAKKDYKSAAELEDISWAALQQLKAGVHENPAIAVLGNPGDTVAGTLSDRVYEVRYRHAQDGRDYKHPFGPGVRATLLKDGRVVLWHPSKPIWKDFA